MWNGNHEKEESRALGMKISFSCSSIFFFPQYVRPHCQNSLSKRKKKRVSEKITHPLMKHTLSITRCFVLPSVDIQSISNSLEPSGKVSVSGLIWNLEEISFSVIAASTGKPLSVKNARVVNSRMLSGSVF